MEKNIYKKNILYTMYTMYTVLYIEALFFTHTKK